MTFDTEYFNGIAAFFNKKDNVTYNVSDLTNDNDKFVFHVKYYIDHRQADMCEVVFSEDYSQVRVIEYFETLINARR